MAARSLRKELRQPDEFVTLTARAIEYAQTHQRTVVSLGIAVLAVILGGVALSSFRQTQWQQANTNLARAIALYNENKLPEAIRAFEELAGQGNAPATFAEVARIYTAQAYLRQGEYARAIAGFEAAQGGVGGFLGQRIAVSRGYAYEGNQQFPQAASAFGEAAAMAGPYTAIAVLGEGRNAESAGDTARALAAYKKLLSEYPDAPERALAESRIAALGG